MLVDTRLVALRRLPQDVYEDEFEAEFGIRGAAEAAADASSNESSACEGDEALSIQSQERLDIDWDSAYLAEAMQDCRKGSHKTSLMIADSAHRPPYFSCCFAALILRQECQDKAAEANCEAGSFDK